MYISSARAITSKTWVGSRMCQTFKLPFSITDQQLCCDLISSSLFSLATLTPRSLTTSDIRSDYSMINFLRCLPEKQGINLSPHFSSFFFFQAQQVISQSFLNWKQTNKQQKTDQHADHFPAKTKARDFFSRVWGKDLGTEVWDSLSDHNFRLTGITEFPDSQLCLGRQ